MKMNIPPHPFFTAMAISVVLWALIISLFIDMNDEEPEETKEPDLQNPQIEDTSWMTEAGDPLIISDSRFGGK